jgi:hypothetical protein
MSIIKASLYIDKKLSPWYIGYGFATDILNLRNNIGEHFLDEIENTGEHDFHFLADPFIIQNDKGIYIFVERVEHGYGKISCFLINPVDFSKIEFLGDVLDLKRHISYPFVFNFNSEYYMIPESIRLGKVILFTTEKTNFPYDWKEERILINEKVKDSTLLINEDCIFLFGQIENALYVWTAKDLKSEFKKDKLPLLVGSESRPGGRILDINGEKYIPIQNNSLGYGTKLVLYQIIIKNNKITLKRNVEILYPSEKIQKFSHGMHHFDQIQMSNQIFAVYDGNSNFGLPKSLNIKHFVKYLFYDLCNFFLQLMRRIY